MLEPPESTTLPKIQDRHLKDLIFSIIFLLKFIKYWYIAVGRSKEEAMDTPGVQIISISCSFCKNLEKWYVGAPTSGKILEPPLLADKFEDSVYTNEKQKPLFIVQKKLKIRNWTGIDCCCRNSCGVRCHSETKTVKLKTTRMHSSRMRAVRSSSHLLGGGRGWGCLVRGGVCSGGCAPGGAGVSAQGVACSEEGVCSWGGVYPSMRWGIPLPPLWTGWQNVNLSLADRRMRCNAQLWTCPWGR